MLLDTSGLYSLLVVEERFHIRAVDLLRGPINGITHSYILAELVALCLARGVGLSKTLDFLHDLHLDPEISVVWVDRDLHWDAENLLSKRLDKTYSLCDAVSFVLMRRLGILEALTTDHHFEQEGFVRLLK